MEENHPSLICYIKKALNLLILSALLTNNGKYEKVLIFWILNPLAEINKILLMEDLISDFGYKSMFCKNEHIFWKLRRKKHMNFQKILPISGILKLFQIPQIPQLEYRSIAVSIS